MPFTNKPADSGFKDVSKDVAAGSADVKKSLDDIIASAEKADKAQAKLSKTQEASIKIAGKFKTALDNIKKSEIAIGKGGVAAAKGLGTLVGAMSSVEKSAAGVAASVGDIQNRLSKVKGSKMGIDVEVSGLDVLDRVEKAIAALPKKVEVAVTATPAATKAAKAPPAPPVATPKLAEMMRVEVQQALNELDIYTDAIKSGTSDAADKASAIELEVKVLNKKKFDDFVNSLSTAEKSMWEFAQAGEDMEAVIERAASGSSNAARTLAARLTSVPAEADAAIKKFEKGFNLSKAIKKQTKEFGKQLKGLEKQVSGASLDARVNIAVEAANLNALENFLATAPEDIRKLADEATDLNDAFNKVSAASENFRDELADVQAEVLHTAKSAKQLQQEFSKIESVTDLVKSSFVDGKAAAEDFAGGLGIGKGAMIGMGVAAFFLLQKLGDLAGQFADAAVGLSKFKMETEASSRTISGFANESLEDMRNQLNLTRDQAGAFFDVVRDGANSLGLTQGHLTDVSKALQSTFGGDQTGRLREYVDLLKIIPTLDTDLNITASLDDESASVFALAKAGKMDAVIDLQSAGLLGGGAIQMTAEDAELINAQQKTEKTIEDVHDALLGFFPKAAIPLAAISGGMLKLVGMAAGGIAAVGAMSAFLGSGQAATTAAVVGGSAAIVTAITAGNVGSAVKAATGKIGGRGAGRTLERAVIKMFGRTKVGKILVKGIKLTRLNKAFGLTAKVASKLGVGVKSAVGMMGKFAKGAGGIGILFGLVGMGLSSLAGIFDKSGNDIAAGALHIGGAFLKAAGTIAGFAALGSLFGPIGTVVGAVIGSFVAVATNLGELGGGVEKLGEGLKKTVNINGKEVPKFGKGLQAAGTVLQRLGGGIKSVDKAMKTAGKAVWSFAKKHLWVAFGALGYFAKAVYEGALNSKAYNDAISEARASLPALQGSIDKAVESSKEYDKAIQDNRKTLAKSGLSLQKALKSTEMAFGEGRFALVDFQKEIAGIRIDTLAEAGASAAGFSAAVSASTKATIDRYKLASRTAAEQRANIRKDDKLMGDQRRQALADLHKKELEATREFVSGMKAVIDALFQAPGIIQAGLQKEIAGIQIDVGMETGGIGGGRLRELATESLDASVTDMQASSDAIAKTFETVAKGQQMLAATTAGTNSDINALWQSADAKTKASLKGIVTATKDGISVQEGDVEKFYSTLKERSSSLSQELDTLKKSLPKGSFLELSMNMSGAAKELEGAQNQAQRAKEALEKTQKGGWFSGADPKEVDEARKVFEEAQKQLAQLTTEEGKAGDAFEDYVSSVAKKAGVNIGDVKNTTASIAKAVASGADLQAKELLSELKSVSDAKKLMDAITVDMGESKKTLEKMKPILQATVKAADWEDAAERLIDAANGNVMALESVRKAYEKNAQLARDQMKALDALTDVSGTDEVQAYKAQLAALDKQAALASALGNPTTAITASLKMQTASLEEQLKQLELNAPIVQNQLKKAEETLAIRQKELDIAKKAAAGDPSNEAFKYAQSQFDLAKNVVGAARQATNKIQNEQANIIKELGKVGDGISKALDEFEDSFAGRQIRAQLDLSDALGEFAEFSANMAGDAKEATSIAIAASKAQLKAQKETIDESLAIERARIKALAAVAAAGPGGAAEGERIMREGEATLQAKKRSELANKEREQKQKVLAAAQREASLRVEDVDLQQQAIDAEADFLSEIGGNFSTILSLQEKSVGLENEKLKIMEEQLAVAKQEAPNAMETRRLELAVVKQQFEVQKKALGAQKSVYEKLMGMAFGALRESTTVGRRRTTQTALLGVDKTRARTRAGLFTGVGPGGGGTIAQRAAKRQAAMGGAPGAVANIAPKRLKIEEQMAKEMGDTSDFTKDTATSSRGLYDLASSAGSMMTHDVTVEGLLKQLLVVSESMARGILSASETAMTGGAGSSALKDMTSKLEAVKNEAKKVAPDQAQASKEMAKASEAFDGTAQAMESETAAAKMGTGRHKTRADFEAEQKADFIKKHTITGGAAVSGVGGAGGAAGATAAKAAGGNELAASTAFNEAYPQGVEAANKAAQAAWEATGGSGKWSGLVDTGTAGATAGAGGAAAVGAGAPSGATTAGGARFSVNQGGEMVAGTPPAAGAAAMGEMPTMKVTGEMTVKFDSAMFKTQLVPIVGQIINTSQIIQTLQKAGFINKNA